MEIPKVSSAFSGCGHVSTSHDSLLGGATSSVQDYRLAGRLPWLLAASSEAFSGACRAIFVLLMQFPLLHCCC